MRLLVLAPTFLLAVLAATDSPAAEKTLRCSDNEPVRHLAVQFEGIRLDLPKLRFSRGGEAPITLAPLIPAVETPTWDVGFESDLYADTYRDFEPEVPGYAVKLERSGHAPVGGRCRALFVYSSVKTHWALRLVSDPRATPFNYRHDPAGRTGDTWESRRQPDPPESDPTEDWKVIQGLSILREDKVSIEFLDPKAEKERPLFRQQVARKDLGKEKLTGLEIADRVFQDRLQCLEITPKALIKNNPKQVCQEDPYLEIVRAAGPRAGDLSGAVGNQWFDGSLEALSSERLKKKLVEDIDEILELEAISFLEER